MNGLGKIDPAIAKKLANEIRVIAGRAHNEDDIKINVEIALKPILNQLGITADPKYGQKLTLLQGRRFADAVYGFGIIEYERPGKIATKQGYNEVVKQLSENLTAKARALAPTKPIESVRKMVGIGLDGENIMYLRYASSPNRARFFQPVSLVTQLEFFPQKGFRRGGFQIVGPMPVDTASVEWLLYSLQFFHRRALEPHGLSEVFGPEAEIAASAIGMSARRKLPSTRSTMSANTRCPHTRCCGGASRMRSTLPLPALRRTSSWASESKFHTSVWRFP